MALCVNRYYEKSIEVVQDLDHLVNLVVHNGQFHLDDVLCAVILALFLGQPVRVLRTRDQAVIAEAMKSPACWICDVGARFDEDKLLFDHHQIDCPTRPDGSKYAAAGLLWRWCGTRLLQLGWKLDLAVAERVAKRVDERLIAPSDRIDNGNWEPGCQVSDLVLDSNPPAGASEEAVAKAFEDAFEFAAFALMTEIRSAISYVEEQLELEQLLDEKRAAPVLELEHPFAHWGEILNRDPRADDVLYVVWQGAGQWEARGVPKSASRADIMHPRKPFPEGWRGLAGPVLAEASGVEDAVFCHAGGFFTCAKSQEGALRLAELAAQA